MRKDGRRSGFKIASKLLSLIGSLSYVILLAVINGSIGHAVGTFIPVLGALAIAKACGAEVALSYTALFIMIIGFGLLRGALRYFEQYSNHYIAFRLLAKIRDVIFKKLRVLCPAKLETKQKGAIISMITADTETIEVFYAHTISPVCIAVVCSLAIALFIGFAVSWYMAAFALFAYIVIGVIMPIIGNKVVSTSGGEYRKEFTSFNGYFMDAIKGSRDIILHGKEEERKKAVDGYTDRLLSASEKMKTKSLKTSVLTNAVIYLLDFGMLALGIALVINGLSAPLMAVGVVALMSSYGPVLAVSKLPENLSQTFSSGDRIISLLEEAPAVTDIDGKTDFNFTSLVAENLSFGYGEKEVLKDVDFAVNKGEIVGIMGQSGCGKSTFLKLLLRFWKKGGGKINYNGADIEDINTLSLKDNVVMVSQSTYLFDDTVRGNLKIAKPSATEEELIAAAKSAGIYDFILKLKDGFDTKIGAGGVSLSAGEAQRIGLARAFLSDAGLILLDEPTSNVDAINEGIILKALKEQKNKRSIVLVSHRESTMSICDKIYKMKDGRTVKE